MQPLYWELPFGGDEPSPVFKERIRHGIWLYEKQYVDFLIFTGGKAEGQKYSEAEVARKFAMEKGVPTSKIFIEEKSTITDENLAYAKLILQEKNFQKALIVSDPLHMKRAMVMMHDHGIKGFSSPTPTSNFKSFGKKLGFAFRESFFLIAYRIQRIFTSTD